MRLLQPSGRDVAHYIRQIRQTYDVYGFLWLETVSKQHQVTANVVIQDITPLYTLLIQPRAYPKHTSETGNVGRVISGGNTRMPPMPMSDSARISRDVNRRLPDDVKPPDK